MSPLSTLLFQWYMLLTFLAVVASITIPFSSLVLGLFLLWLIYIFFFLGSNMQLIPESSKQPTIFNNKTMKIPLGLVAIGAIFASIYATKFYTGRSVIEVYSGLRSGTSLYNEYQKYFIEHSLGAFFFSKTPAVLALLYLKLSSLYGFIFVIIFTKKVSIRNYCYLLIIAVSQLFFSVARGTSFELFELLLLLWFCMTMRRFVFNQKSFINVSKIVFILLSLAAVLLYSYNISARYSFGEVASCATKELCLTEDSLLYNCSIILAKLSYKMSGYFTFGIYYTSMFIEKFWLSTWSDFFSILLPFADIISPRLTSKVLCGVTLDCGVSWIPDIINYILRIGVLTILSISFFFGILSQYFLQIVVFQYRFLEACALYFIFFTFVSLPIGSFISVSSANKLCILFVFAGLIYNRLLKIKIYRLIDPRVC